MNEKNTKKSLQAKCPNCGANLKFSAKTGGLMCDHCAGVVDVVKDKNVRERDFSELDNYTRWSKSEIASYRCKSCGAISILPSGVVATTCQFCAQAVVIDKDSLGSVKPNSIIPFEVTKEEAQKYISKWRKKRLYAPRSFRKKVETEKVSATYIPVWTFDAYTTTAYKGRLGKRKTRTVRRNGKTYTKTYTQWFYVSGTCKNTFDDVLVNGNNHVPAKNFNSLKPFPQNKYVVYSNEYLLGYTADNYTVEPKDAFAEAQKIMRGKIQQEIICKYNADVVGNLDLNVQFDGKSFKLLFVPMFITATQYKNKTYNNYVGGLKQQNDKIKVTGNTPKSPWKILATVLAGVAAVVLIALLII